MAGLGSRSRIEASESSRPDSWPPCRRDMVPIKEAHDLSMAKTEPSPMYACMMPKSDLRRVEQPHDERVVITRRPLRRMLAKLTGSVRL